jgi:hypothetical protein
MEEFLIQNARIYAEQNQLRLAERLGFGIHGIVFVAENKARAGRTAIKIHREAEPFQRERSAYERLLEAGIAEILGFNVPQLVRADDRLLVIEMTVVTRPFVLDFAGAFLDVPPDFPDEIWEEWEIQKREQFEGRWPQVRAVLGELENLGIHMLDVSPSNISVIE